MLISRLRTSVYIFWACSCAALALAQAPSDEQAATAEPTPKATASAESTVPAEAAQVEYRDVVKRAINEFDAGRFAEARALFLHAHELWPSARTWRTLGMTAFELRQYPRALVELQAALADPRRPLDESQRQQVASLIEQTRAFVGRYRLRLSPSDAALMLDGTPLRPEGDAVLALAVGDHELRARAPGYGELRRVLQVQGREDEPLALELAPLASPAIPTAVPAKEEASALPPQRDSAGTKSPAFRTGAIVAFGVGGAAVVISAVMGGLALKRKQTVEDDSHCPNEACPPAYYHDKDQLLRFANASTATAVIGAAGLALGASLWLLGKRVRAAAARALRIESPTGLGFTTISGRF